jgi:glucose-6-phosphate 1-dehydrogenase
MGRPVSHATVFFGATGDLACKQIFPSLQGLVRDEGLDVPIIGVAKAGRSLARAKDSLSSHGGLDTKAFAKLTTGVKRTRRFSRRLLLHSRRTIHLVF